MCIYLRKIKDEESIDNKYTIVQIIIIIDNNDQKNDNDKKLKKNFYSRSYTQKINFFKNKYIINNYE